MESKTTKHSLKDLHSSDLESKLLCQKCIHSSKEGHGAYFAGYHEYYALVCDLMPISSYGERAELDGGENFSAPTDEFPDGYAELISECSEFKPKS